MRPAAEQLVAVLRRLLYSRLSFSSAQIGIARTERMPYAFLSLLFQPVKVLPVL